MGNIQEPESIRVGFVLHVMQVAGAEMLVAETIRRLGSQIVPVVLCLDGVGELGFRLRAEGVPVVDLQRKPGLDLGVARRLAREIDAHQLDVIHAHQYTPFFYSALARFLVHRPVHVILTEHGRHFPDHVSWKRRFINRFFLSRCADEINGVCQFSVDSLRDVDGFRGKPLQVIPNGIDFGKYGLTDKSAVRAELGLRNDITYVTCIGRFHPVKDHATLLRAFHQVVKDRDGVELLLAGDGPLRGDLVQQVEALGISSKVHFLGVRNDVPRLLAAADVFALTSISEAASLTLLEAMASRLPVIVTAVGGNPEIVEHGVNGFLVPRGDDSAVAEAMLRLVSDRDLARTLGEAGRARTRELYQLDRTVRTHGESYQAAAASLRRKGRSVPVAAGAG